MERDVPPLALVCPALKFVKHSKRNKGCDLVVLDAEALMLIGVVAPQSVVF
jgi:hypothetical protein